MRIALNPIQWMASDDGWLDPSKAPERKQLLSLIKQSGFDAVMAEVPADWTVGQYRPSWTRSASPWPPATSSAARTAGTETRPPSSRTPPPPRASTPNSG